MFNSVNCAACIPLADEVFLLQECSDPIRDASSGRDMIPFMVHRCDTSYLFTFELYVSELLGIVGYMPNILHTPYLNRLQTFEVRKYHAVLVVMFNRGVVSCSRRFKDYDFEGIYCVVLKLK